MSSRHFRPVDGADEPDVGEHGEPLGLPVGVSGCEL